MPRAELTIGGVVNDGRIELFDAEEYRLFVAGLADSPFLMVAKMSATQDPVSRPRRADRHSSVR